MGVAIKYIFKTSTAEYDLYLTSDRSFKNIACLQKVYASEYEK